VLSFDISAGMHSDTSKRAFEFLKKRGGPKDVPNKSRKCPGWVSKMSWAGLKNVPGGS
jgi:hypothetical protein